MAPSALVVAAALVLHGAIVAGTSEARTVRQEAARALEARFAAERTQAAQRLRSIVEATRDRGDLRDLPFPLRVAEVPWTPAPADAEVGSPLEAPLLQEAVGAPAAALTEYLRLAEGRDSATASRALVEASRLLTARGDSSASVAALRHAAAMQSLPDRDALRAALALSRVDPAARDELRRRLADGFAGVDPTLRLAALREIAPGAPETLAMAAVVALRDATDPSHVAVVAGTHLAWTLDPTGPCRVALVPFADAARSLLPSVVDGLVDARVLAGTSDAPPLPRIDLVPTALARTQFDDAATRAAGPRIFAGVVGAAVLLAAATLVVVQVRARAELDRRKDAFLCAVTHELKTPVANILLYAETIENHGLEDPGRVPEFAGVIAAEANRLEQRIGDMLVVASGRGNAPPVDERFDAMDVIRSAFADAAVSAAARGRAFATEIAVDTASARGSTSGLRRALAAILDNALVHGAGRVRAAVSHSGAALRIVVEDEGPGLPASERERVFEPFVRLGDERTRTVAGTGLGLAVARQGVSACGGTLHAESCEDGRGARFVVEIPPAKRA
jgi:signal transduction histidine kinase